MREGWRYSKPGTHGSQAPWGTPRITAEDKKKRGANPRVWAGNRKPKSPKSPAKVHGMVRCSRTGIKAG